MNADSYHEIATGPFAPLYPFYAERILMRTGVCRGTCLDLGCGGGYLGLAVAARMQMNLVLLDESPAMLAKARENLATGAPQTSVTIVAGRVQAIPLADASIDLVVSRGSIPFWSELPQAFREIWRVLRPGGHAVVGGGMGTAAMRQAIFAQMKQRDPVWRQGEFGTIPRRAEGEYEAALHAAGIAHFEVSRGELGTWIAFQR